MNEQRNISLQGRSLAFSANVGRAYGERRGPYNRKRDEDY
jgi:hypothetical protein